MGISTVYGCVRSWTCRDYIWECRINGEQKQHKYIYTNYNIFVKLLKNCFNPILLQYKHCKQADEGDCSYVDTFYTIVYSVGLPTQKCRLDRYFNLFGWDGGTLGGFFFIAGKACDTLLVAWLGWVGGTLKSSSFCLRGFLEVGSVPCFLAGLVAHLGFSSWIMFVTRDQLQSRKKETSFWWLGFHG